MNTLNIKRRRPYCQEEQFSEQPVLHNILDFQHAPIPSTPSLQQPSITLLDSVPNQHNIDIIEEAAAILNVPVQALLGLRSNHNRSQQSEQQQQSQPHPQQYSAAEGPRFKRPRLSDSISDTGMFSQSTSQPAMDGTQGLDEKGGDGIEGGMVVTPRPYNFEPGGLTTVTLSISNCMGNLFCPPFESNDYTSPLTAPSHFEYGPSQVYEDTKPPVREGAPFDPISSAPLEAPRPAPMFTSGPMDDPQINYLSQYPAMQPTTPGTLAIQPPRSEEMVYPPMASPASTYFSRRHPGVMESGLDGSCSGSSCHMDGAVHVTQSADSATTGRQVVHTSGIPGQLQEQHRDATIPAGPGSGNSSQAYPGTLLPPNPGHGIPSHQDSQALSQRCPPTPHGRYPGTDSIPYVYGNSMYSAERYPGYDVVWPPRGRPPSAKRGPFKNNADREKTAQTRRIGSCIRCRMQRIRCHINDDDEKGPCLTCAKIATSKVWRLPCLRYKITDIHLFKPGKQVEGCEWTRRWAEGVVDDIGSWESLDIRVIQVSEGFCENKSVKLEVRRFIPQDGDKLERSWIGPDGSKRSVKIPPYAICDTQKAKDAYQQYIDDTIVDCFNFVLGPSNELLQRTYRIALSRSLNPSTSEKERKLLKTTLRLWMSIRLTTRSAIIVGDETLGMSRNIMDHTSPLAGKIPLPPVMGAQIDLILINQIQKQWRKDALEMLQDMVQHNKQKTWMTTYLVTYMLLHNTALITSHDAGYARKHGIPRRFAREAMVGKYHEGANVLLAYWHYCNKSVYPFSKQCKDSEFQQLASLDEGTMQFIRATRAIVNQQKSQWEHIQATENSEDSYYFISQMYEESWKPRGDLPVGGRL